MVARFRLRVLGISTLALGAGCLSLLPGGGGGGDAPPAARNNRGFEDSGSVHTDADDMGAIPPVVLDPVSQEQETESFFAARAIDPASEDSAGPKFVEFADFDNDGIPDIATAWNQSQVVQIHLQRRDADQTSTFEAVQIAGTTPIAIIAGIKAADMDADGATDIVVLVKHRSFLAICPVNGEPLPAGYTGEVLIMYSPGGNDVDVGARWASVELTTSREEPGLPTAGTERANDLPEDGGMTALDVGDVDNDGMPDIVITSNVPDIPCHRNENDVELYLNPGAAAARNGNAWMQVVLDRDAPPLKDLLLLDVDDDGDLDVVFTRPIAASQNVSWRTNPRVESGLPAVLLGSAAWAPRPIGQVDNGADVLTTGDVDQDGFTDIVVRSSIGQVIQWFRHPSPDDPLNVGNVTPDRLNIPWSVFTLLDLPDRMPLGVGLGDINFDGQPEVVLGSEGQVLWLDSTAAETVYDPWTANLIVDDRQLENTLFAASGPAFINRLSVFDLDCDGANDIIATMDRRSASGLSNDVVIWFRSVLRPEDVGIDEPLTPVCRIPPP